MDTINTIGPMSRIAAMSEEAERDTLFHVSRAWRAGVRLANRETELAQPPLDVRLRMAQVMARMPGRWQTLSLLLGCGQGRHRRVSIEQHDTVDRFWVIAEESGVVVGQYLCVTRAEVRQALRVAGAGCRVARVGRASNIPDKMYRHLLLEHPAYND